MASRRIDDLHPLLAYAFGLALGEWRIRYPDRPQPILTATYRSPAEQDRLFRQPTDRIDNDGDGRIDEPDERVTAARAGESPHNFLPALAFDVAFQTADRKLDWSPRNFSDFAQLVLKAGGITWGGSFRTLPDAPHFELAGWKTFAKIGI